MQLLAENPYESPCVIEPPAINKSPKASLRRGLYYAGLWGMVVFPVPFVWFGMQIVLRPDQPPLLFPEPTLSSLLRGISGLCILPAFFGLIAVANYTPPRQYSYLVTFLYFAFAWIGVCVVLGLCTEWWGGPFYLRRRYPPLTEAESTWNFGCIAIPMVIFAVSLTCWRIESSTNNDIAKSNHAV